VNGFLKVVAGQVSNRYSKEETPTAPGTNISNKILVPECKINYS